MHPSLHTLMYTCMHTRTHVHAHVHMHAHTHPYTLVYTCMHTHARTHAQSDPDSKDKSEFDWWSKYYYSCDDEQRTQKDYVEQGCDKLVVYPTELEEAFNRCSVTYLSPLSPLSIHTLTVVQLVTTH